MYWLLQEFRWSNTYFIVLKVEWWPILTQFFFLFYLQILLALNNVRYHRGDDRSVWDVICKSEYRRCAVIECYESMKHVLRRILRDDSAEYQIYLGIFEEIDASIIQGRFTSTFMLPELLNVHSGVVHLVELLLSRPTQKQLQKVGNDAHHYLEKNVLLQSFPLPKSGLVNPAFKNCVCEWMITEVCNVYLYSMYEENVWN